MKTYKYSMLALAVMASTGFAQEKPTQKDEQDIETLVITASPFNRSILETATPVSIIGGEELKSKMAPTLGETLKDVPGVHSSYFGPVASSPIIRGLDGPRIKVVQNGLDVSDASRVGPDHVVTTEATTAHQIEVLRGPATLLYGSGAIGGVVNIVDNRLAREAREGVDGEVTYLHNSVSDEDTFSLNLDGGSNGFVWHLDGFDRSTEDYEVPSETGMETLENSFIDGQGYTGSLGWVSDDFRISFAYGKLENEYGIPGHSHDHGHEEDEHDEHEEDGHDEHAEEEVIFGRLDQDRYQGMVDWLNLDGFVSEVHWHQAYTDYTHAEIEGGATGTTFDNESHETRIWAKHQPISGWEGVFGINYVNTDFSAVGEEAFTPPSETESFALFLLEEKRVGDFLWQVGARLERSEITPDNSFFEAEEEHHDEHDDEHEDEHEDEHHDDEHDHEEIAFSKESFTAFSASAGAVYTLDSNSSLAFNYAYSQRAPSAAEIFSNGPHIGTGTFEIGAGFELHAEDDGDFHLVAAPEQVEKETSNNIDITYRYSNESMTFSLSGFYNQVDDYLYQENTGLFFEDAHGHDEDEHHDEHEGEEHEGEEHEDEEHEGEDHHEDEHGHEDEEGLPVFIFRQRDARLYGFEAELDLHINENLRLATFADYTRAKLKNGGDIPRIPPFRIGAELHYEASNWHAEFGMTHYAKQDKTGELETETDSYTLVNASFNYYIEMDNAEIVLFAKGNNLTDEEARVHSSFIKDEAPLPGRSFIFGTRVNF